VLTGLVLVGASLRLWHLGSQGLWYDEWLTADAAQGGLGGLVHHVAKVEGIGPTYFVGMWGWVKAFGSSELSLRFVSVVFGVATIPAAYAAARALGQRRAVGLVAALFVAVHPMLVWYSQEARPYSLLALCGALSVCAYARARDTGTLRDYLLWGGLAALTVSIHYFGIFLIAVEGAALLAHARTRWRTVLVGSTPLAVGLIVLAPLAASQRANAASSWIADFAYGARLSDVGTSALVGPSTPETWLWRPVALIVVLAAVLLVVGASDTARRGAAVAAGLGGGALLLAIVTTLVGPDFLVSRYVIASLVPLIVAVAIGLTPDAGPGIRRALPWVGGLGVAAYCIIAVGVVATIDGDSGLQKPDWQAISDTVTTDPGAGHETRAVVMNLHGGQGQPLHYYLDDARALADSETARVRELDVLVANATSRPCSFLIGRACAMVFLGASLPDRLAAQFGPPERIDLGQFTVERYRADQPVPITTRNVLGQDASRGLVMVFDVPN
jgi:4-amino-4-deoxy-L-arabinose transferase-like glycosyltransferase